MTDIGMMNHIDYIMSFGYTYEQAKNDIYTMGWTEGRENLYAKSDSQVITEMLEMLQNMYNTNQCGPSAWVEIDCYLDASYREVSNIDDAEYVNFIIYC